MEVPQDKNKTIDHRTQAS